MVYSPIASPSGAQLFKLTPLFWQKRRHAYFSLLTASDRRRKIVDLFVLLFLAVSAHIVAMMAFEGLGVWQAFWLTMTTITTVGYGDIGAVTPYGQVSTIVIMYIFGIFVLAQIGGEWIDFRLDRRERMRKGLWRWEMQDHIVILNAPDRDGERYLAILVQQIRATPSLADYPIQIFSPNFPNGLPVSIASEGVVLRNGSPEGRESLDVVDVAEAAFVIVMSVDTRDFRSDSVALDLLDQLKQHDLKGHVIVECVQDENRDRLRRHGADAVMRPVRAYPELMVRAMAAPGTEVILENLLDVQGVRPERFDVGFPAQPWNSLAARLIQAGFGTPMGYIDTEGNIVTNPSTTEDVEGRGVFLMVGYGDVPDNAALADCIGSVGQGGQP